MDIETRHSLPTKIKPGDSGFYFNADKLNLINQDIY